MNHSIRISQRIPIDYSTKFAITQQTSEQWTCNAENSHIRQIVLWSKVLKIVCALYACLANSLLFDIDMLHSTTIENTNNIFYCSVKPTYVAFLALTLITTNYCSGTFLALQYHNILQKNYITILIKQII